MPLQQESNDIRRRKDAHSRTAGAPWPALGAGLLECAAAVQDAPSCVARTFDERIALHLRLLSATCCR